jgi:hypothetical protein
MEESSQYAAIANRMGMHIGKKLNVRFLKSIAIIPPQ